MRFPSPLSIMEISNIIAEELGKMLHNIDTIRKEILPVTFRPSEHPIEGISTLDNPISNTLVYVSGNKKNIDKAKNIEKLAAVITVPEYLDEFNNIPVIVSIFPKLCMSALLNKIKPQYKIEKNNDSIIYSDKSSLRIAENACVGPNCHIGKDVSIGQNTVIHPHVYIGNDVEIGHNVIIHPNVSVLDNVRIGNHVILHPGCVIGGDGFGYQQVPDNNIVKHVKMPHAGAVVIEDNVEIGCNTTVDRGFIDNTIIREGTKIDNNVQVAHNVNIGRRCIIAGQVGIAGNSKVGDEVVLFGQVGIADNINIGNRAILTAQSGVMTDIPGSDEFIWWAGTPATQAFKNWKKVVLTQKQLPALISSLRKDVDFEGFKNRYFESIGSREKKDE